MVRITGNDIGDEGVKALADALKSKASLTELDMGCKHVHFLRRVLVV